MATRQSGHSRGYARASSALVKLEKCSMFIPARRAANFEFATDSWGVGGEELDAPECSGRRCKIPSRFFSRRRDSQEPARARPRFFRARGLHLCVDSRPEIQNYLGSTFHTIGAFNKLSKPYVRMPFSAEYSFKYNCENFGLK